MRYDAEVLATVRQVTFRSGLDTDRTVSHSGGPRCAERLDMNQAISVRPTRMRLIVLAVGVAVLTAGCGLGGTGSPAPRTFTEAAFDPKNFVDPRVGGNPWFPLKPGMQWLREGTTLVGNRQVPNKVVVTITDAVRVIGGVKAVLAYDHSVAAGQVVQESLDYFAQDRNGAVWILAGATEQFEAGRFVAVDEVWMGGVDGSKAGTLMPANPTLDTPAWSIAQPTTEDGDAAKVARMQAKECEPLRCFTDVLVIEEGKRKALNNEFKYYVRGVGQIRNEPLGASRHEDIERLINVTQLSAAGLTEATAEALRIDAQAAKEWPHVFGKAKASRTA